MKYASAGRNPVAQVQIQTSGTGTASKRALPVASLTASQWTALPGTTSRTRASAIGALPGPSTVTVTRAGAAADAGPVAGGASGRLKGGRHLRHPKNTPMANLLVAMLDKLEVTTDKLGDSTGPISL